LKLCKQCQREPVLIIIIIQNNAGGFHNNFNIPVIEKSVNKKTKNKKTDPPISNPMNPLACVCSELF